MGTAPQGLWPPAFEAAIFDFDGTISQTGWIWHEANRSFLARRGIAYSQELAIRMAPLSFEDGAACMAEECGLGEPTKDICAELSRISLFHYRSGARLRPGVEEYLRALRSTGIGIALATSNSPEIIGVLEHVPVSDLFDHCVYERDVGVPKNRPDIYLEAARRLGCEPSRCAVFEDITTAARTAHEAGFVTCGVRSGDYTQDMGLLGEVSDMLLSDWEDIPLG